MSKSLGVVYIQDPSWGYYRIETDTDKGEDATFFVLNTIGSRLHEWQTIEGATAHIELLVLGWCKEVPMG